MKIYIFGTQGSYINDSFASCGLVDWSESHQPVKLTQWKWGNICPLCQKTVETLTEPLQMRWIEGSEVVGDVVGTGEYTNHLLIQQRVVDFFNSNRYFATFHKVEFHENPYRTLSRSKKAIYPIVSLPYTEPKLMNVRARYGVCWNLEKTGIKYEFECSVCGYQKYDSSYSLDLDKKMIVIDEEEWNGLKIFKIFDLIAPIDQEGVYGLFVSEEGRDMLIKEGFSNMRFKEVGRIEKAGTGGMKPYREKTVYDFWKPEEYVEPVIQNNKRVSKRHTSNPQ